jgi:hypothetical protein
MPEKRNYESHLSLDAVAFVVALPRRKQKLVLDLADQIAAHPFQIGDYQTVDAAGRSVENLLLENYLFSFWVDHASRELRISEIIQV